MKRQEHPGKGRRAALTAVVGRESGERCPVPHWLQCATVCTRDTASALGLERERGRPGRRSARLGASDRARAIEPRSHETCARMSSNRRSPLRGRAAGIAVCIPCGIRHGYGTRGISHPQPGRRLRAPPNNPTAANGPGCIVLVLGVGRCAFRPPRVVFVLGLVSLINSLTSGKTSRF